MGQILIVDDIAALRRPVALVLRGAGYDTCEASSGSEALAMVRTGAIDLIVLDLSMPKMDGMQVLRQLRANAQTAPMPVILLTATADKNHVVEAAQLGVRDYMLKTGFSMTELLARVRKYVPGRTAAGTASAKPVAAPAVTVSVEKPKASAASVAPAPVDKESFIARVEAAMKGRTLSGVVSSVMSMAASPRADMAELANLIQHDSVLSARILQSANSAAYASGRGAFTSIPEAIKRIGCAMVRNIASSIGIFEAMPETSADGCNAIRCWQHSFATARLCDLFCGALPEDERGLAYIVGLCHDLSEILLRSEFNAEYTRVLDAHAEGIPLVEAERSVLGVARPEIIQAIHKSLQLPQPIAEQIETFHRISQRKRATHARAMLKILNLADQVANAMLLTSGLESTVTAFTPAECKGLAGAEQLESLDQKQWLGEIQALTIMLARLRPSETEQLAISIVPRKAARIWLCRSSEFMPADPLSMMLANISQLTVEDRLPDDEELENHHGIVIIAPRVTNSKTRTGEIDRMIDAKPAIPILWLSSEPSAETRAEVQLQTLPVSLAAMALFAERCAGASAAPADGNTASRVAVHV